MKTTTVVYTEPFLTSWPVPFSGKEFGECFLESKKPTREPEKTFTKSLEVSATTKVKVENFNIFKFFLSFF